MGSDSAAAVAMWKYAGESAGVAAPERLSSQEAAAEYSALQSEWQRRQEYMTGDIARLATRVATATADDNSGAAAAAAKRLLGLVNKLHDALMGSLQANQGRRGRVLLLALDGALSRASSAIDMASRGTK